MDRRRETVGLAYIRSPLQPDIETSRQVSLIDDWTIQSLRQGFDKEREGRRVSDQAAATDPDCAMIGTGTRWRRSIDLWRQLIRRQLDLGTAFCHDER